MPVAWCGLSAGKKGAWRPHWERLLGVLSEQVPSAWTVLVLADRRWYAQWLYKSIPKQKWPPLLRIKEPGFFRVANGALYQPCKAWLNTARPFWSGQLTAFKSPAAHLACTLLAGVSPDPSEPWLLLSDFPPDIAEMAGYGRRAWREAGFKAVKRGGWAWHQTPMPDPQRASRLWLVMAVARLWVLSLGG